MTGAELIAAERQRQVEAEGWTPEHDDGHDGEELALAAACYAMPDNAYHGTMNNRRVEIEDAWPWNAEEFKGDRDVRAWGGADTRQRVFASGRRPNTQNRDAEIVENTMSAVTLRALRVRELVKAGALVAAEIDRLQRMTS